MSREDNVAILADAATQHEILCATTEQRAQSESGAISFQLRNECIARPVASRALGSGRRRKVG